jgi:hypothetical protein
MQSLENVGGGAISCLGSQKVSSSHMLPCGVDSGRMLVHRFPVPAGVIPEKMAICWADLRAQRTTLQAGAWVGMDWVNGILSCGYVSDKDLGLRPRPTSQDQQNVDLLVLSARVWM